MENFDNKSDGLKEEQKRGRINVCGLMVCAAVVIIIIIISVAFAFTFSRNENKYESLETKNTSVRERLLHNLSNSLLESYSHYKKESHVDCEYNISTLNKDRSVLGHLPWEISLFKNKNICIASIISERWALTAAHCFDAMDNTTEIRERNDSKKFADSSQSTKRDSSVTKRRAIKVIKHPLYKDSDVVNDIALILVDPPFKYRFHGQGDKRAIAPVCLPEEDEEFLNREVIISGIGRREHNSTIDVLVSSSTKIIEDEYCLNVTGRRYKYRPPLHICVALPNNKIGPCKGDSGGPVVVIEQKRVKQIGLISFGKNCTTDRPSVLTNVVYFRKWLKEQTGL